MRRIRVLVLVPLFSPFLFVLTDTTSNGKKQSPRKSGQIYEQDLSLRISLSVLQICTLFSPHGIVSFVRSLVPFRSGEREVIQTASGLDREIKTRRKRGVGSSSLLFLLLMLVLLLIGAGGSDLFCIRILSVRFCFFEENFFRTPAWWRPIDHDVHVLLDSFHDKRKIFFIPVERGRSVVNSVVHPVLNDTRYVSSEKERSRGFLPPSPCRYCMYCNKETTT